MTVSSSLPIAHPYARISDPAQRKGGGLERQTTANLEGFCRQFGFHLSKRVWVDDGVSAFNGLNASPHHQLGQFFAEARKSLVRPGDCLLIENYDRLSRQNPWAAIGLVNDLRQLGIHVGRLDRMKLLRADSTDVGDFFEAAIEFMRGNSESAMKSMRNGSAWIKKREAAREKKKILTRRLPAWVEERDGKMALIPARAAVVKRIFHLAAEGYGYRAIVKRLADDKVPPFGEKVVREGRKRSQFSGRWTVPYVIRLLNERRAMGEYQPCGKDRKPDGPPIPNYFPAAVTEEEFWAARAGADQRRTKAKNGKETKAHRIGKHINLFPGLVYNALDGDSYIAATKSIRVLLNAGANQGTARYRTFPMEPFERAVLSRLREIDPHEILNGDGGPDEALALSAELARLDAKIAELEKELLEGDVAALARVLRTLEEQKKEVAAKLALARQRAAHPLSESWGQVQTLADVLDGAADPMDVRLRLRAALRRIVAEIWILVVPCGRDRLCAAQIYFADRPVHRDYLIYSRAAGYCRKAGWSVRSFADVAGLDDFDLRRRKDARVLERVLAAVDVAELAAE